MRDYRINSNYAKALFMLADELGEQEQVCKDMRLVRRVCVENRELNVVFDNPEIKADKKVSILAALFGDHVGRTVMAFLAFVARKKRAVNLKGISTRYLEIYRDSRGIVLSHLTTAYPADDAAKELAGRIVSGYAGKEVEMESATDPKVIGGFSLEFDNMMLDATFATQLARLRRQFEENVYESKL